jgi:hypothetical protein
MACAFSIFVRVDLAGILGRATRGQEDTGGRERISRAFDSRGISASTYVPRQVPGWYLRLDCPETRPLASCAFDPTTWTFA